MRLQRIGQVIPRTKCRHQRRVRMILALTEPLCPVQYGVIRHVVGGHMESMTEPVLLILLSLAGQPRHGYSILQDTEEMSEGRVRLSTGTLYGALRRLLESGWIERVKEVDTP